MVATCDDDFRIPSGEILIKPKNLVYSDLYNVRDIDVPGGKIFLGASFHQTLEDRTKFFQNYRDITRIKERGQVPYTYYQPILELEATVANDFYDFITSESLFRSINGVLVIESNLIHMLRFNLIQINSEYFEREIAKSNTKYPPELMTQKRLEQEIAEDTRLWYAGLNLRINLE